MVKEFLPNVAMLMERNADYHGTPAQVEHIAFRFYIGNGAPVRLFEDGEIDVAFLTLGDVNTLNAEESSLADELIIRPQLSIHFVGFNTSIPPFDDPLVRRAFLLALDRKTLVEETLAGIGTLAKGFLPPSLPGFDEDAPEIPFSPFEAQELLKVSSYGGAENLPEIVYSTAGGISISLREMARMWQENLGVSISANILPAGTYYDDLEDNVANLYDYGWIADYPDPHNFLDVLFHSGAENNVGKFSDAEIDGLLEQARTETDQAVRLEVYRQVERLLVARAAAIPLWSSQQRLLIQPYVLGFTINEQGHINLSAVSLVEREE
jgi:ABC-type oligopeptide transport system substrate-binding subunit